LNPPKPPTAHSKIFKQKIEKEKYLPLSLVFKWMIVASPPKENHHRAFIVKKGPPPAFKPHLIAPQRSTVLRAGSWRIFTLDRIFYMMIIGQQMADIRHGGGGRKVPFSGFVWSGVF
jgi:hypothetical protein